MKTAALLPRVAVRCQLPRLAQAVYGSISGNVTDASGAAVPNAKITITDVGKGVSFITVDQRIRQLHARPT